MLAVAYEYTYGGVTYQVGEFASDLSSNTQALFVKLLKGTTGSPSLPTWRLMMKNVYNLGASNVQKEKFRLDIKYQSDSTGVYLTYLPEASLKNTTLLRAMNLDRLDSKGNANADGQFDFVEGFTMLWPTNTASRNCTTAPRRWRNRLPNTTNSSSQDDTRATAQPRLTLE